MRVFLQLLVCAALLMPQRSAALEVLNDNCFFWAPEGGSYIESYFLVFPNSVKMQPDDAGKLSGSLEFTYLLMQEDSVILADKYRLNSPLFDSASLQSSHFSDTRRKWVEPGTYILEVHVSDLADTANKQTIRNKLVVPEMSNELALSGISLIGSYEKSEDPSDPYYRNGLRLLPRVVNFFPGENDQLRFYCEIYHSAEQLSGERFLAKYRIVAGENQTVGSYAGFKKMETAEVNVLFTAFDLTDLHTGNYYLLVEILDSKGQLKAERKLFFQRLNRGLEQRAIETNIDKGFAANYNSEELKMYLSSLYHLSERTQQFTIESLVEEGNLISMRNYLEDYWHKKEPLAPKAAWENHLRKLRFCNKRFSTSYSPGYDTDRGILYLKYGPPSDMRNDEEPGGYEWEIWQYYKLPDGQTDVRFAFYNPTRINNDFEMIHSNGVGEINDPNWKMLIYRNRNNPGNNNTNQIGETLDIELANF